MTFDVRVTVAGWTGSSNLGDELVFAALARILQDLGADVTAVSVDPDGTRRDHGVDAVPVRPDELWRQAGRTDLGVFGGGGLIQDESSLLNLPYHLARPAMWSGRGVPWVGIGLGAGPVHAAASRALAGRVLRRARVLTVRDTDSAEVLAGLVGVAGPPVRAGSDLAFTLPVDPPEVEDVTVVCLRGWTGRRRLPAGRERLRATSPGLDQALATALDRLAGATGRSTRFVAFDGADDDAVHARVVSLMNTPTERKVPGVREVVEEVGRGAAVVAMRYHALVAATLTCRPAVALTYSSKVSSLAADLGGAGASLGLDPARLAALPAAVGSVAAAADRLPGALAELVARAGVHREVLAAQLDAVR